MLTFWFPYKSDHRNDFMLLLLSHLQVCLCVFTYHLFHIQKHAYWMCLKIYILLLLFCLFVLFICHSYWWFSFYSNFNVFFMVNSENISIDTLWSIELIKLTEKVRAELSLKGEVLKMLKSMFKTHGRRVNSPGFMTWNAEIDFYRFVSPVGLFSTQSLPCTSTSDFHS